MMAYAFSTLYHSIPHPPVKAVLRKLDHISIFVLIAGTYTPFVLKYLPNSNGRTLLLVLWALVGLGTLFKVFFTGKFKYLSTAIYLGMGWMLVFVSREFFSQTPPEVIWPLVIGGISYSAGVIFYLWKKLPYHHAIWHLFVLGGSVSHWVAIYAALG